MSLFAARAEPLPQRSGDPLADRCDACGHTGTELEIRTAGGFQVQVCVDAGDCRRRWPKTRDARKRPPAPDATRGPLPTTKG